MRAMLYEAAHILLVRTTKWSWLKAWAVQIARRLKKAVVALARRLAVITAYGVTAPSSGGPGKPQQHERCAGSTPIGGNSSSTPWWNDVLRGTMDEVRSYVRLDPAVRLMARPSQRSFCFVLESHDGRAWGRFRRETRSRR
jgi:hypothetical protein